MYMYGLNKLGPLKFVIHSEVKPEPFSSNSCMHFPVLALTLSVRVTTLVVLNYCDTQMKTVLCY